MLQTIFGTINITVNGKRHTYSELELPNQGHNFKVDKRFRLSIDNLPETSKGLVVECILEARHTHLLESGSETGENLALISFTLDNQKLSIGTIGDIPGAIYEYQEDRMLIKYEDATKLNEIVFYVAWITMNDIEKEEIYTWFAATPHAKIWKLM